MTTRYKAAPVTVTSPESALASHLFDQFVAAATFKAVLSTYRQICEVLHLKPTNFPQFYPKLKAKLKSWKATSLWNKLDKRATHKCYNRGKACANSRVLIIGAGPCGLRCAIEAQLLGAKVVVVDKRDRFSRNNVLHLWPFVIHDLRSLGAKKFFGKFCAGSIDHISIRQLQLILLKVALLLGVEVHENATFKDVIEPPLDQSQERIGWKAQMTVPDHPISNYEFDVLIGADGKRNTLQGFKRNEFRGKLAIAITANFMNRHSPEEARVSEISGVAFIFNQKFFLEMKEQTKIDLENIVYYKDDTHYFVMTAKKHSLLEKGVIIKDFTDTARLLAPENVNREALMEYARQAADFSTDHELPHLDFAVNHYGQADVAMFDFTSMYAAENACRIIERRGHKLLLGLVGDSLLEPFWPTGSGCGRGFLSALDMAWMCRSLTSGKLSTFQVLAERESIYRLLAQITPENLNKNFNQYTLNPSSRYPNLNINTVLPSQTRNLFDTDSKIAEQLPDIVPMEVPRKRKRESVNGLHPTTLLTWCKRQVAMYDSVYIENLGSSWKNGMALCAIVHRYRPDLIEFNSLDPAETVINNQMIFDILDKEFGITPFMTGQEMSECETIDQPTMVSYLTRVYEVFKGEIPYLVRPSNQSQVEESPTTTIPSAKSSHQSFLNKISSKLQNRNKRYSLERELNNVRASAIRKRTKDLRTSNTVESNEVMLTCYKKLLNTQEKMSFTSRKKILEEKFRKDAGLHRDLEINGSGDHAPKQIDPLTYNIELLEKQLTNPDSFWITEKKETPKVTKLKKDEWNIKLLEEKLRPKSPLKDPPPERPKVMKDIFDNKLQKMNAKLKANGGPTEEEKEKYGKFDSALRNLQLHLKEGNNLDVGTKGQNQVSLLKQHMETLWSQGKEPGKNPMPPAPYYSPSPTPPAKMDYNKTTSRCTVDAGVLPQTKMEIIESCNLCHQLIPQVEKVCADGMLFHRSCFKCEYCDLNLHIGAQAFDLTTGKFYCRQHFRFPKKDRRLNEMMLRKQAFISGSNDEEEKKKTIQTLMVNAKIIPAPVKPPSPPPPPKPETPEPIPNLLEPQSLGANFRDQTPERVEFENSLAEPEESDEMKELDEDELTQKNFGEKSANQSDDDVSDLSTDSGSGEEAFNEAIQNSLSTKNTLELAKNWRLKYEKDPVLFDSSSSDDSDTEQGSGDTTEDVDSSDQYSQGGLTPLTDTKVEIPYLNWKNLSKDEDEDLSTEESCSEDESDSDLDDDDMESDEDKDAMNEKMNIPIIVIQESPPQNSEDQEWSEKEAEAYFDSGKKKDLINQLDNDKEDDDVVSIEKIKRKAADFVQNIIEIANNQVKQMEEPVEKELQSKDDPSDNSSIQNGDKYSRPSPPQSLDLYTYNFDKHPIASTSSSNGPLLESDKSTSTDNSPPLSMPYSKLLESPFQDSNQIFIEATNRMQQCMDDLEITTKKTPSTPVKEIVSPTSPLEDDCFVADNKYVTIRRPKKKRAISNDSWENDKDLPSPWCLNESQEFIDLDAILRKPQMQSTPKEGIFRATPIRSTGDDEDPSPEPSVPSPSNKLQRSPSSPATSKYKGYSGSFVEKVRPKSNDGESLYLKSLNINLQRKEFPLLTKSTERLNTNNDFTLSPIVKSPDKKGVHFNPIYQDSKLVVSPTSSIVYKPTIDCTMVTPVPMRNKNPLAHPRLLRNEPRQSVHESIEGVPFADEERHNSSPIEEVHHSHLTTLANGLFRATPQILTRHHSMIQDTTSADGKRSWPKKEDNEPQLNPTFRQKKFGRPSLSMSSIHYEELDHDEMLDRDGDEMDAETDSVDGTFLAKRVDIYEPDELSISKASPSSENLSSKSNFSLDNNLDSDYSPPPQITTDSFSIDELCTTPTNPKQFDFNTPLQNNPKRSSSETNTNHLGKKETRPKSYPDKPPLPRKQPSPRSSNKKSIFSLLTFGKNGFTKEKKSSKDEKRSSSLPAELADKTSAKQRTFPHFKFTRVRERGREKQREKYIVAESSDNALDYKDQGNGNALHYKPPTNHYVTTSQAPLYNISTTPLNTMCSSSNLENGLAPKASEDSFTDEEEQLRISKEDTLFVKTLKSQMAANPYSDKKSRLVAQKVQRQYDMKCLRMAQEIQRQLDELEIKQLEVENQSKDLEVECNEAPGGGNQSRDVKKQHYQIKFSKNKLAREKKELYIKAQDLELEHQQRTLQQEIRQKMSMNDDEKTPQDIENEGKILATMLEIVEKRDCLVKLTDKLKQKAEEEDQELQEQTLKDGFYDVM